MNRNYYVKLKVGAIDSNHHAFAIRMCVPLPESPKGDLLLTLDLPDDIPIPKIKVNVTDSSPRFKDGTDTEWELSSYQPVEGTIQENCHSLMKLEEELNQLKDLKPHYHIEIEATEEYEKAKQALRDAE
jgi:hypothetical protein